MIERFKSRNGGEMIIFRNDKLVNTDETIAKHIFDQVEHPWEVLPNLDIYIKHLGPMLPSELFEDKGDDVYIAKSATVAPSAYIKGPCIIDEDADIRHCAFIRGSVIVGKGAVVGNSTELKNSILFNQVEVPHYNYVGDSILGFKAHLGAGSITSNIKNDKTNVVIKFPLGELKTDMRKLGAIIGDYSQIGCNCVLNPGTIIGRNVSIYPLNSVRGHIRENTIYKSKNAVMNKI